MQRDPTLRRRNALVIPGALLVMLSLAGIVYAQTLRTDDVTCEDGRLVVFAGACRSASLLLAIPFAIGALLLGTGIAQRKKVSCSLGHGTGATTVLAILVTLFALPFLAAIGLYFTQDADNPAIVEMYGVDFTLARLLGVVATAMLVALVPYLGLYMATASPPRCCREKECFEPCFCDEDAAAPPTFADTPPAAEVPPAQAWTPLEQPPAPAVPPPLPPPPAPPEPVAPTPPPAPAPQPVAASEIPPAPHEWPPADEEPAEDAAPKAKSSKPKKSTRTVTRKKASK